MREALEEAGVRGDIMVKNCCCFQMFNCGINSIFSTVLVMLALRIVADSQLI